MGAEFANTGSEGCRHDENGRIDPFHLVYERQDEKGCPFHLVYKRQDEKGYPFLLEKGYPFRLVYERNGRVPLFSSFTWNAQPSDPRAPVSPILILYPFTRSYVPVIHLTLVRGPMNKVTYEQDPNKGTRS